MPNVWLVRSPEYSLSRFREVRNLLNSYKGVLKFFPEKPEKGKEELDLVINTDFTSKAISETKELEWFYEKCNEIRKQQDIGDDEMVMLLTDFRNPYNYFNGIDFETGLNMMVHTADWDKYIPDSDECNPVVYHVAATVLIRKWFNTRHEAQNLINLIPQGCMMDFCKIKKDVKLKILTANISDQAIKSILEHGVDPNLLRQTLRIFEGVRENILFGKYSSLIKTRTIELSFKGDKKQIYFPEISNGKMELPTLFRVAYIYLLKYSTPDTSLHFGDLANERSIDHLFEIYNGLFRDKLITIDGEPYLKRRAKIENTFSINNTEKWEQLVSKTNRALVDFLGEDLAKLYIIQSDENFAKRILVDRSFINGL
ncbi:hypothetical protein [Daejeonella sp.]|jgi:hypothetical protein|uniref:hypothetical protein n=1 Tax=Daejeonella sp. TaxID=2805397 RepID=UPI0037BE7D18